MSKIKDAIDKSRTSRARSGGRVTGSKTGFRSSEGAPRQNRGLTERFRSLMFEQQELKKFRVLNTDTQARVMSAYKMLRTRLLHRCRSNGWHSIAVTSAGPNDGKTLTAINLALSLAEEGNQNVFLVDLDLRNPSVNEYLAVDDQRSIIEFLTDKSSNIDDFIYRPPTSHLFIVGNSLDGVQDSSEHIFSPRMDEFLEQLKDLDPNGLFIFDLPPVLSADDMLAFAPHADAVLFIIGEGDTSREELGKAYELLTSAEVELAGVVLNRSVDAIKNNYY